MPRYNPEVDEPYKQYVASATHSAIKDTRTIEVLAHVFTNLAASLSQKVGDRIVDRTLFGENPPPFYRYSHRLPILGKEFFRAAAERQPDYLAECDIYCITWPTRNKGIMLDIQIPIGEYGMYLGWAIMDATRAVYHLISDSMKEECSRIDRMYKDFIDDESLTRETAQGHSIYTLIEGAHTIGTTLALLTLRRVPGFEEDPLSLIHRIHEDNILNELSQRAPSGLLAPMAREGIAWARSPLEFDIESSTLRLTEEAKQLLTESKVIHTQIRPSSPAFRHRGCPAGKTEVVGTDGEIHSRTGIDYLTDILLRQLDYQYPVISQQQQEITVIQHARIEY